MKKIDVKDAMKCTAYLLCFGGLITGLILSVSANLTDYRIDLIPFMWVSWGINIFGFFLIIVFETWEFIAKRNRDKKK